MDVYHKLKQKLSDNFVDESDGEGGQVGGAAQSASESDPAVLNREIGQLKEHINKNYFVYVKRLEKRKERIKELEEYVKLLIADNETANERVKGWEECQRQLQDYRDNLDQLEGFQSQELAKVKHMLLSAETALEKEGQRRKQLECLLSEKAKPAVEHVPEVEASEAFADEQSPPSPDPSDPSSQVPDLQRRVRNLVQELSSTRAQLAGITAERDSAQHTLLEMEITHHDHQNHLGSEREKSKMDIARLATEKETLEVALERRDRELKSKKESFRQDTVRLEKVKADLEADVQVKAGRIRALEAENQVFLVKMNASNQALAEAESQIEHESHLASLVEERYRQVSEDNRSLKADNERLALERDQCLTDLGQLREDLDRLNATHLRLSQEFRSVSEEREHLRSQGEVSGQAIADLESKLAILADEIAVQETTFDERVQASAQVQDLEERLRTTLDELTDKKNILKVHQQKMADMKKTFQKEMKSVGGSVARGDSNHTPSMSSPSSVRLSPTLDLVNPDGEDFVSLTDVNFRYLKHVIFKFFTSREYEALHLTRAMAALLRFTPDEEKLFQEHLEWKMSWFGAKPKSGSGQFSLSINSP
eukprot:maker-scaffold1931_size24754-snap-gene-0.11 protein:Tk10803 transcript:maker-scaffold1931_size24754-snap-gene-0.11-mRNA-1 annotation:"golgin subfamily a member"